MIRAISIYILALVLAMVGTDVVAQATISAQVAADTVVIGDVVQVDYTIRVPIGTEIESIDLSSIDSTRNQFYTSDQSFFEEYMDWSVLPSSDWSVMDKVVAGDEFSPTRVNSELVVTGSIDIAIYSVGLFQLADPVVIASPPQPWMRLEPARIMVAPPQVDTTAMAEKLGIKDIMREPLQLSDFLPYILLILALLFFIWVVIRWRAAEIGATDVEVTAEPEVVLPSHSIALAALDELEQEQLWQQGAIKAYQSRLTTIIRKYLEGRYDIPALELTTDEITRALSAQGVTDEYDASMRRLLQMADLVKFAKAKPEGSIHAEFMEEARAFVRETMIISDLPSESK